MILRSLSVLNYKNIASAELSFSPCLNCFIGQNGEGKTNVLDALYLLSMCRSHSSAPDGALLRHGEALMMVSGQYESDEGVPVEVSCGMKTGARKVFRRDKKAYTRLSEHLGFIPLVMVSPSDGALIGGGSEERRRFLDVVIAQCEPAYVEALARYNKALTQRNALLKQEEEPDASFMEILEEQMAEAGEVVYARRRAYVEAFVPTFQHFHSLIATGREAVGLEYTSHCQRGPLLEVIRAGRAKDRAIGYSLHGIHRDDLLMTLSGFPLRREGSQGQNKTFLVAMKLAQYEFLRHQGRGTTPLLLLDDLFDKLDATRVEQIVHLVASRAFGQTFITDTNRDHLDQILRRIGGDQRLFHVAQGTITL